MHTDLDSSKPFPSVQRWRLRPLAAGLAALTLAALAERSHATGETQGARVLRAQPQVQVAKPPPQAEDPALKAAPRLERSKSQASRASTTRETKVPEEPSRVRSTRRDPNRVCHVEGEGGTPWVRGASYKASFGSEGATYIPFLGSDAPRNYPVRFSLAEISVGGVPLGFEASVTATRQGDTIAFDRGTLLELYEIGVQSIEQKFVFPSLPSSGELVVRMAVESELAGAEESDGLTFRNALGGVRYGRATALDATGASTPVTTTWTGSGIELRVPAEFVAVARFPLLIDPVVDTFNIDSTSHDDTLPDVAYDATTNRWLTVYEEAYSASDHDVVFHLLDSFGNFESMGVLDSVLSAYWARPAVANNDFANQFLMVAQVGDPASGSRVIRGRTLDASTLALSANILISTADQVGDKRDPDVGGDNFDGTVSFYCVVWEREFSSTDHDIHARCVRQDGTLYDASTILIEDSSGTNDINPAIAKGTNLTEWGVVWQRSSPGDDDIRGAILNWDGSITAGPFSIDSTSFIDTHPDVSTRSDDGQYLVTYERDHVSDHDIVAVLMEGAFVWHMFSLTDAEDDLGADNIFEDQLRPSTDCDGHVFVVAYAESLGGSATDYDVRVSTLSVIANELRVGENHQYFPVGFSSTREDHPSVAAAYPADGGRRRCFVVWQDETGTTDASDIEGGLYDAGQYTSFCHPNFGGALVCPCSNPPSSIGRGCDNGVTGGAQLVCTGYASLIADSMLMTSTSELASALSIFTQGNAPTTPSSGVVFGQGVRCVGGSLKRLYTKNASLGAVSAPTGPDPDVHLRSAALGDPIVAGSSRYYYVYYRQPTVLGGCPSSSTFNATQAVQAIWAP